MLGLLNKQKFCKFFYFCFVLILFFFQQAKASDLQLLSDLQAKHTNIPSTGLKVFWWNIGCGLESSELKNKDKKNTTVLELNLIALSKASFKPDVLILGEFCPYTMSLDDQNAIKSFYKNNIHIERNVPKFKTSNGGLNQRNGFWILSDMPIELKVDEILHAQENSEQSHEDRKFVVVKVLKNNKIYFINPVHLVNPWRSIYAKQGLIGAGVEVTLGQKNANAVQTRNLIQKLKKFDAQSHPFLTIGDFNSPGNIYGLSGYGYSLMANSFIKLRSDFEPTFLGDGQIPASDIDHAFGLNLQASYAQVWPLEGSRHLPLYLVINEP